MGGRLSRSPADCIQYYPWPPCGHGKCVSDLVSASSAEDVSHSSARYCQCFPGWSQTFEMAPYTADDVDLKNLPCVLHETIVDTEQVLLLIVASASLIKSFYWVVSDRRQKSKKSSLGLNAEGFQCFFALSAISLFIVAAVFRLCDPRNRIFVVHFGYTTLLVISFTCAKSSQLFSFYKYIKYNLNPVRLPFVSDRSKIMFSLTNRVMLIGLCLEFTTEFVLWAWASIEQQFTSKIMRIWMVMYGFTCLLQTLFSWVLFTNVIRDIDTLLNSPIPRYSEQMGSKSTILKERRQEIWNQRLYQCSLAPLYCTVLFCCVFMDGFFSCFIYVIPIDMACFSLKTPFQLKYDLVLSSTAEKDKMMKATKNR